MTSKPTEQSGHEHIFNRVGLAVRKLHRSALPSNIRLEPDGPDGPRPELKRYISLGQKNHLVL